MIDKDTILLKLQNVDKKLTKYSNKLKEKLNVILIGASSLILKYNLKRTTFDINMLDRGEFKIYGVGTVFEEEGFHIVSEAILNLHPDYEERLEKVLELKNINVYCMNPYDIAISKIARGFQKDFDDILKSDLIKEIDIEKLKKLYFEAMDYWIGDERKYKTNFELFENEYRKIKAKN